MKEILAGVFHWVVVHPRIEIPVSSYWLRDSGILLDPLLPQDGAGVLAPPPRHVLLTNRHHYRDSGVLAERFGCTVWCVEQGLHEFTTDQPVRPFRFGDELPGRIEAFEIGALCPDETALIIPGGIVALADGVIRRGDGPLSFVPDALLGETPDEVKRALRRAYRRLLERDFEHLLLAHGDPWIGGANHALRDFIER